MRLLLNIDVADPETGIAFYEAAGNGFCLLRLNGGVYEAAEQLEFMIRRAHTNGVCCNPLRTAPK